MVSCTRSSACSAFAPFLIMNAFTLGAKASNKAAKASLSRDAAILCKTAVSRPEGPASPAGATIPAMTATGRCSTCTGNYYGIAVPVGSLQAALYLFVKLLNEDAFLALKGLDLAPELPVGLAASKPA